MDLHVIKLYFTECELEKTVAFDKNSDKNKTKHTECFTKAFQIINVFSILP